MGLHPQLGSFTEKQKRRLFLIKEIGCVACIEWFGAAGPGGDGHHAEDEDSGRAYSHEAVICLCPWHHVAKPPSGYNSRSALAFYGPSRHGHAIAFAERFGNDQQLLEKQNVLLAKHLESFVISPL